MATQSWGRIGSNPYEPKRTPSTTAKKVAPTPPNRPSPYDAGAVRIVKKSNTHSGRKK